MQLAEFLTQNFFKNRKASVMRILTFFDENRATTPLLVYKITVKHQEKEINQLLKEQIMLYSRLTFSTLALLSERIYGGQFTLSPS